MKTWNIQSIMSLSPCYTQSEVAQAFCGARTLTTEEILRRENVPYSDRVWVAAATGALPTDAQAKFAEIIIARYPEHNWILPPHIFCSYGQWVSQNGREAAMRRVHTTIHEPISYDFSRVVDVGLLQDRIAAMDAAMDAAGMAEYKQQVCDLLDLIEEGAQHEIQT